MAVTKTGSGYKGPGSASYAPGKSALPPQPKKKKTVYKAPAAGGKAGLVEVTTPAPRVTGPVAGGAVSGAITGRGTGPLAPRRPRQRRVDVQAKVRQPVQTGGYGGEPAKGAAGGPAPTPAPAPAPAPAAAAPVAATTGGAAVGGVTTGTTTADGAAIRKGLPAGALTGPNKELAKWVKAHYDESVQQDVFSKLLKKGFKIPGAAATAKKAAAPEGIPNQADADLADFVRKHYAKPLWGQIFRKLSARGFKPPGAATTTAGTTGATTPAAAPDPLAGLPDYYKTYITGTFDPQTVAGKANRERAYADLATQLTADQANQANRLGGMVALAATGSPTESLMVPSAVRAAIGTIGEANRSQAFQQALAGATPDYAALARLQGTSAAQSWEAERQGKRGELLVAGGKAAAEAKAEADKLAAENARAQATLAMQKYGIDVGLEKTTLGETGALQRADIQSQTQLKKSYNDWHNKFILAKQNSDAQGMRDAKNNLARIELAITKAGLTPPGPPKGQFTKSQLQVKGYVPLPAKAGANWKSRAVQAYDDGSYWVKGAGAGKAPVTGPGSANYASLQKTSADLARKLAFETTRPAVQEDVDAKKAKKVGERVNLTYAPAEIFEILRGRGLTTEDARKVVYQVTGKDPAAQYAGVVGALAPLAGLGK